MIGVDDVDAGIEVRRPSIGDYHTLDKHVEESREPSEQQQ